MKLAITSDIHLDYIINNGKFVDKQAFSRIIKQLNAASADYLVIAGDLCSLKDAPMVFEKLNPTGVKKILYVSGNHCYCGVDIGFRPDLPDHVVFLESDKPFITGCGKKIVGNTLWTEVSPRYELAIQGAMIEYFKSHKNGRELTVFDINELNAKARKQIFESKPDIVISHHPPSWQSLHPAYTGSNLNEAFYNSLDEKIMDSDIALWIHGHTHWDVDYTIGGCRVVHHCYGQDKGWLEVEV